MTKTVHYFYSAKEAAALAVKGQMPMVILNQQTGALFLATSQSVAGTPGNMLDDNMQVANGYKINFSLVRDKAGKIQDDQIGKRSQIAGIKPIEFNPDFAVCGLLLLRARHGNGKPGRAKAG